MRKLLKPVSIALVTTALSLSFALSANQHNNYASDPDTMKVEVSKTDASKDFSHDTFVTPADEQLNKVIREKVSRGYLWDSYKEVILNTNNGVVTLAGTVADMADQEKLTKEIQKIDGVKEVKSNLTFSKGG